MSPIPLPIAAILLLVGLQPPEPPSADLLARAKAQHQGVWRVESFLADGRETPTELARSITRTVEGDHVVWKREGKSFAGTTVELDPRAKPSTIDVIPDGGKRRGERVLGIYKLDGDTLVICMAAAGKPRPAEFQADKGSGQTLMTFRREKPTPPDGPK